MSATHNRGGSHEQHGSPHERRVRRCERPRRASIAHGAHEKRLGGEYDANWPDWYAEYMVREQTGGELPT
jgi:hypothetical protein